ncbi:hypothetical protein C7S16_1850 [Burkholderia thailandensis]|uniref:Uncharacterized protein n=1 Tax=Burkholderia thailandensis TaxID=57975 RepID=A0AAW9CZ72_BURTH|nr:hypothetical protein [Burkholderia thailandensis]MDW9254971.1 hypothetical protein [Burkholderia thailandensis]
MFTRTAVEPKQGSPATSSPRRSIKNGQRAEQANALPAAFCKD